MIKQLRQATLECQGLTNSQPFGRGKKAVLSAIEHLGYIQIDTLSVVERAHHHTLWTRVPDYQNQYLEKLIEDRSVFEYWFHAAAYLPMKDYRFALPLMHQFKRGEARYYNHIDPKILQYVHDRIRIDGPQKARDFKSSSIKSGSWWDLKPSKVALEKLFMQGDLMVSGRVGMEKIYDLTERVLPNSVETTEPSPWEFAEHLVKTHLRAYGVTDIKQITHLRFDNLLRKNVDKVLQNMLEAKTIQPVKLDGMPNFYVLSSLLENTIKKPTPNIHLLSPFDNSIIHRERVNQLFDFDFRLECYTPKEKRQYGYFCLPILFGDEFIGRVDCKVHRKLGQLEIIYLHIESREKDIELWIHPLIQKVQQFATFNGCQSITLPQVNPKAITGLFKQFFEEKSAEVVS